MNYNPNGATGDCAASTGATELSPSVTLPGYWHVQVWPRNCRPA